MKFEKLTENKIRIILNIEDLKEKNIDFHSFMSNSLESQDLFLDMLEKAEEEIGFITKDYKLIIEAIASPNGHFVLTVTRVTPENEPVRTQNRKVYPKRRSATPSQLLSVYSFNTFDEFCEFCTYITSSSLNKKLKKSTLYQYNHKYYLALYKVNLTEKEFKSLHCTITEFSTYIDGSEIFERKLVEHGKTIMAKNAIDTCLKHFG
ncbi:MAG: adaptor protein MecA [Oscillospiraceae bacterium]|nr:adaptor protein MecA [Oscillospiraceae bacterium]